MIYSMTGYAAKTRAVQGGVIHVELKSVNSRYLDCLFRVCDELRLVEPALRELVGARLTRGKLECRVSFASGAGGGASATLNADVLDRLRSYEQRVRNVLPLATPLSVADVLRWPGVFGDDTLDLAAIAPVCLALAADTLDELNACRAREGEKMAEALSQRVGRMRTLLREVEPRIPEAQAAFAERLRQRLLEVVEAADGERMRQEVAFFAARIDVAEELTRLAAHLDEVERVLAAGGASGKRLDFLMQELNREANTLASKSLVAEVSQTAIEFKLLIEQMREQVQNLE
ncbi:MAG TPA: YicC family protein [Accumulibacter sp.]|uniref:YicC/YloC family endoribonuclease n=1 Tax=Accumulibacter sp. TaxID=2053492 RepID=UPI002616BA54|nr:YicC/YloC family endoribonuclease [Accumulibacter sp.]HMV04626.1 YicC family protein [Accumulibacter sp.]HMW63103.1 YicC family protein [Accumulibacter sp.]HMW81460.1 YicC family protein [Accumulibacter sp.]HMX69712.1 YicC family protein [Accumulibacter sp.]HNB67099.1 YicC family protein [Accumulibacter sp.]